MTSSKVTKLGRLPEGALDDYYIEEYLDQPSNKSKAYLKAYDRYCAECREQGIAPHSINRDYARQYAKAIHERLRERINSNLLLYADDDKAFGRAGMRYLAENAESESVRAQMYSNLAKGLYPDVQITKQETMEDIDKALEQTQREIEHLTGVQRTH